MKYRKRTYCNATQKFVPMTLNRVSFKPER